MKLVKFDLLSQEVTIYPNPAKSVLNFEKQFTIGITITIFNSIGQLIETGDFSGNRFMPKKLKSGIDRVEIAELNTGSRYSLSVRFL